MRKRGLHLGAPAPGFRLPGLFGDTQTLDALRARGLPVLVLFTDPDSGPCIELAPEVARWQRAYPARLTIAVIESDGGGRTGADEHGRVNVLREGSAIAELYGAQDTPTAVLVGADGTIASPPAAGGERIRDLVARTAEGFQPRAPAAPAVDRVPDSRLRRRELVVGAIGAWPALGALLPSAAAAARLMRPRPCDTNRDCRGRKICIRGRCDFPECGGVEGPCPGGKPCIQGICVECYGDRGCEPFTERCEETAHGFECKCNRRYPDRCEGKCTDFTSNNDHCGGCGESFACRAGEICVAGECVGGDGSVCTGGCDDQAICCQLSDPPRATCIHVRHSDAHCGGCNRRCAGGERCCNGRCRAIDNDPANCGQCGRVCASGEVCGFRECRARCQSGTRACRGSCVHTGSDPKNCGGCGTKCSGPFDTGDCCNGTCCDINADTCCGASGCTNLNLDSENCGGCGNACASNDPDIHCYCRFGTCTCEAR